MRDVVFYLDTARERAGLASDNQLAKRLGKRRQAISGWREGVTRPSPDILLELADMAGVCREIAMLDYLLWQVEHKDRPQPQATRVLRDMLAAKQPDSG